MRIYEEVEEEEEEERPWEEVIKRRPSPCYSTTRIEVIKKKKAEKKKKWRLASVIIYQSNISCLQSIFFNGSLFSTIQKPKDEKERWGWESLPSTALLNIFCKSELKDRLQSIPLVCKSWKYVTDDPRCWSSMIPDSVSPEDAFIKNSTSGYKLESYVPKSCIMKLVEKKDNDFYLMGISRLFKEEGDHHDPVEEDEEICCDDDDEEEEEVSVGLTRLRTLIKKSGGGAAITTLYLSPFTPNLHGQWHSNIDETYDEMLHLIANCCPNLKHISFEQYHEEEALFQLFNKCKKLELVDLPYADGPLVIQEMGKCLPNLRGIRIRDWGFTTSSIATYLPQLKLLSLGFPTDLSVTLFSCLELQYLYVEYGESDRLDYPQDIVDQASAQIPEFYFQVYHDVSPWHEPHDWSCSCCLGGLESTEHMVERKRETYIDNTYLYIRKQRKEDQYVSILKNDQNVSILKKKIKYYHILKRKERDQCNSRLKKKKKKCQNDSTLRKQKKDQCDYADYVIR